MFNYTASKGEDKFDSALLDPRKVETNFIETLQIPEDLRAQFRLLFYTGNMYLVNS